MTLDDFVARLEGARPSGSGFVARCPGHEDRTASLSVSEGEDGRLLLHCHAGCELDAITEALGLRPSDLFQERPENPQKPRIVATYDYTDETGTILYQVTRREPKDFRQRRPDGKGGWVNDNKGTRKVPYHLPLLVKEPDRACFIVEGEKDADSLVALGLLATTNTGGAGKWSKDFASWFQGRDVAILPDNDDAGRKHGQDVARKLRAAAKSIRVIDLEGLPAKADVSDWLAAGHTADELKAIVKAAPLWTGEDLPEVKPATPTLKVYTGNEILNVVVPEREMLLAPILRAKDLAMVYGTTGFGKSWVAHSIALAVAEGGSTLGWKADRPRRVLLIDGELPLGTLQERLRALSGGNLPATLTVLSGDVQDGGLRSLASDAGQKAVEPYLVGVDLVILDNLATLCGGLAENDSEAWYPVQSWLLSLRRAGHAVLFVHHAGKGGQQRGTSSREDVLDLVLSVQRPNDYDPEDGCRVEIRFQKSRGLTGRDSASIEAKLSSNGNRLAFLSQPLGEDMWRMAADLAAVGKTTRQIAEELGISQSSAGRYVARAGRVNRTLAESGHPSSREGVADSSTVLALSQGQGQSGSPNTQKALDYAVESGDSKPDSSLTQGREKGSKSLSQGGSKKGGGDSSPDSSFPTLRRVVL
jgi:hypothetical protein